MDGLDIFNVYVMGSIEMLTVFHFFTRFLKKKVKFIYYILFAIFGIAVIRIFTDGSIMELLVYVLLLMAGGFLYVRRSQRNRQRNVRQIQIMLTERLRSSKRKRNSLNSR